MSLVGRVTISKPMTFFNITSPGNLHCFFRTVYYKYLTKGLWVCVLWYVILFKTCFIPMSCLNGSHWVFFILLIYLFIYFFFFGGGSNWSQCNIEVPTLCASSWVICSYKNCEHDKGGVITTLNRLEWLYNNSENAVMNKMLLINEKYSKAVIPKGIEFL